MQNKTFKTQLNTTDRDIRAVLVARLQEDLRNYTCEYKLIEELGVQHGSARVDIAVVNGIMHGYEIKSDLDTFYRLPEQIQAYNAVFDKVTIAVGMSHLYEAIQMVPDWWGVMVAKKDITGALILNVIRESELNTDLDTVSIARLLWKEEALNVLQAVNADKGIRSKSRSVIYDRLAETLSQDALRRVVRDTLCFKRDWRADQQLQPSGG